MTPPSEFGPKFWKSFREQLSEAFEGSELDLTPALQRDLQELLRALFLTSDDEAIDFASLEDARTLAAQIARDQDRLVYEVESAASQLADALRAHAEAIAFLPMHPGPPRLTGEPARTDVGEQALRGIEEFLFRELPAAFRALVDPDFRSRLDDLIDTYTKLRDVSVAVRSARWLRRGPGAPPDESRRWLVQQIAHRLEQDGATITTRNNDLLARVVRVMLQHFDRLEGVPVAARQRSLSRHLNVWLAAEEAEIRHTDLRSSLEAAFEKLLTFWSAERESVIGGRTSVSRRRRAPRAPRRRRSRGRAPMRRGER